MSDEEHGWICIKRLTKDTKMFNDRQLEKALFDKFKSEGPTCLSVFVSWSEDGKREAIVELPNEFKAKLAERRWNGKNAFTENSANSSMALRAKIIQKPAGAKE